LFDVHEDLENDDMENHVEDKWKSLYFHPSMIDEDVSWFRDDVSETKIDTSTMDNYWTTIEALSVPHHTGIPLILFYYICFY